MGRKAFSSHVLAPSSLGSSLNVLGIEYLQIRLGKNTHFCLFDDKASPIFLFLFLFFFWPQKIQHIFDLVSSCCSECHLIIEGLYSCRIWHMLTVHWMGFPVHHVEFFSQVLASSSLRIRLLPLWQGDYSTKMRDHVSLLSLNIELFFGHLQKKYLLAAVEGTKIEVNRGRIFLMQCCYSMLWFCTFYFSV